MQDSKVMLSEAERLLANNATVILTKNSIIEKVYSLFGNISKLQVDLAKPMFNNLPEVFGIQPKISKGEQYDSLPWVMLDYPRCFSPAQGHFAIRVFFWWGNYFVVQAQCSGSFLQHLYEEGRNFQYHQKWPLYAGIPEEIWNHKLPQTGLSLMANEVHWPPAEPGKVFKIAIKIPIDEWEFVPDATIGFAAALYQSWGNI